MSGAMLPLSRTVSVPNCGPHVWLPRGPMGRYRSLLTELNHLLLSSLLSKSPLQNYCFSAFLVIWQLNLTKHFVISSVRSSFRSHYKLTPPFEPNPTVQCHKGLLQPHQCNLGQLMQQTNSALEVPGKVW